MGLNRSLAFLFVILTTSVSHNTAFYLPGLAPVSYCEPGKQTSPGCLVSVFSLLSRHKSS